MPVEADVTAVPATVSALPLAERRIHSLECSIAGFAGHAPAGPLDRAVRVDSFEAFSEAYGTPFGPGPYMAGGKLAHAVRGFFRNGGSACWIARVEGVPGASTVAAYLAADAGLQLLETLDEPTVIATPDAHAGATGDDGTKAIQRELVTSCERVVGRIALVDPPAGLDPQGALDWRSRSRLDSPVAATYFPWIEVSDPSCGATVGVPPCGHVAGLWARVDSRAGPHRAPTAEAVLAVDDAEIPLSGPEQHRLNRAGVNCLRAWPGPELRAWGACTLSSDPELRYLHRQRTVGHLVASIAQGTRWATDEPNEDRLHESLRATVTAFLHDAWRNGALLGDTAAQAFFVRCDSGLNDSRARARDEVILEVGLAVRRAGDFRVLRISHRGPGI